MPKMKYRPKGVSAEGSLTVTIPEAAVLLGVSECTAHAMIKRGQIPIAFRSRHLIRISRARLIALINGEPGQ
jgi:excisionase family DNA binding protein